MPNPYNGTNAFNRAIDEAVREIVRVSESKADASWITIGAELALAVASLRRKVRQRSASAVKPTEEKQVAYDAGPGMSDPLGR